MAVIKAIPAQTLTFKTSDNSMVEGDFVVVSGDMTVSKAGAGVKADGVVVVAPEMGLVTILINKPVLELVAGSAVTAGQEVEIDATGKVAPKSTGEAVGKVFKGATAGNKAYVAFYA